MTKVMATEWASLGIRINALAPGSHLSDGFDSAAAILPDFLEGSRTASLQKRVAATNEIVGSMIYLASDMSSFTAGSP